MKRVLGFIAGLLLLLSPIGLHADPRNIVVDDAIVSSTAPLPISNDALTDATDADTGIYIKPATGAIFTISGATFSGDVTLSDTDIAIPGGVVVTGTVDATFTDTGISVDNTVTVDGSGVTQPVSGTFYQVTQPVSGTFWQIEQPVSLSDKVVYDTQLEQFKFTGNDLRVLFSNSSIESTLTDTTIQATDLDIRDLTSASDSVDANLQVEDADVSESNSVPTHEATGSWWTEYRYNVDDKVTFDTGVTITKAASDGHEYIATGYSIGSFGCGHGDWQLKVNGSVVAVGGFGPDAGSQGAYKFPIPIKAGNNEAISFVVTPRTENAYVICTLYGYE